MRSRGLFRKLALFAIVSQAILSAAQDTPEQALVEAVTSKRPDLVEKHLPVVTVDAILHLVPADRQVAEQAIVLAEKYEHQGLEPRIPADGRTLLEFWRSPGKDAEPPDAPEICISIGREIIGGADALLELRVDRDGREGSKLQVWMRLEEGEWRVTELEPEYGEKVDFDSPGFVEQFRRSQRKLAEVPVLAKMRWLNTALVNYASSFPEIGFPEMLAVLGPPAEGDERSAEHASLFPPEIAAQPYISDGYVFDYKLLAAGTDGAYSIVARPVDQTPAAASFFTDDSGVIRYTLEDREPAADDDPVE